MRAKHVAREMLAALGGTAVVLHVAMTGLHLLPRTFALRHIEGLVERYMAPLFRQNWHFFAPDPSVITDRIVGRCRFADGHPSIQVDPFRLAFGGPRVTLGRLGLAKHQFLHQQMAAQLGGLLARPVGNGEEPLDGGDRATGSRSTVAAGSDPMILRARAYVAAYCRMAASHEAMSVDVLLLRTRPVQLAAAALGRSPETADQVVGVLPATETWRQDDARAP